VIFSAVIYKLFKAPKLNPVHMQELQSLSLGDIRSVYGVKVGKLCSCRDTLPIQSCSDTFAVGCIV